MARQGNAEKALSTSILASTIGGMIGAIILLTVAPPLAKISILFGPPEYFLLAVFGITIIGSLSPESTIKGVMAGLFGLILGMVGVDPLGGIERFTFGQMYLLDGLTLIPMILGLFAFPRCIAFTRSVFTDNDKVEETNSESKSSTGKKMTLRQFVGMWRTWLRSSIIGTIIGIIPAAGANIACFVAYSEAKRNSKDPSSFGKGSIEGIMAAESSNNAVCGGSLVPLLTLSIPGNAVAAVILGGLMIHGLVPGPQLFVKYASETYTFILGLFFSTLIMFAVAWYCSKAFAKVAYVPVMVLAPTMLLLSLLGSFCTRQLSFDIWVTITIGLICYLLTRAEFPMPAILLGAILGPIAERGYRRAMLISHGNPMIFVQRPLSLVLILLTILSIYGGWRMSKAHQSTTELAQEDLA